MMTRNMKNIIRFTLTGVVILLLWISLTSAHGSDSQSDNDMGNGSMMDDGQMQDMSEHMLIEGSISVNNAITLSIDVSPSEDMIDEMDNHMGNEDHMRNNNGMDYMNEITISFQSLVEFEDLTNNGFSSDDTVLSSYYLTNDTLNDPELIDGTYYQIISKDNDTFKMKIDLKFQDNIFFGLKWSVDINYAFTSSTSQLAMIHKINTGNGPMMEMQQMIHGTMYDGSHMQFQENHMEDNDDHLPMFFDWADTVDVDGVDQNVIATGFDDIFALSVPQGSNILYDPEIGVNPSSVFAADDSLNGFMNQIIEFVDTLDTPTLIGLVFGITSLVSLTLVAIYFKRK